MQANILPYSVDHLAPSTSNPGFASDYFRLLWYNLLVSIDALCSLRWSTTMNYPVTQNKAT